MLSIHQQRITPLKVQCMLDHKCTYYNSGVRALHSVKYVNERGWMVPMLHVMGVYLSKCVSRITFLVNKVNSQPSYCYMHTTKHNEPTTPHLQTEDEEFVKCQMIAPVISWTRLGYTTSITLPRPRKHSLAWYSSKSERVSMPNGDFLVI